MKKLKYITIAVSIFITLFNSACQKQLDIKPVSDVEQDLAIKNSKDVEGVLVGAYTAAALRGIYGGRLMSTTDFLGDDGDIDYEDTYSEYTEMINKQITINNGFAEGVWDAGYSTIAVCNTVLTHLDLVDPAKKDQVEGEAKFLRGMTYFDLARVYGRAWNDDNGTPETNLAVPIVLIPTTSISGIQKVKRNTVAEVYAQAISDLQTAETNLAVAKSTYANSSAASAILARIYLTQEKFDLAEDEATKIIGSGIYTLVSSYKDEFQYPDQATHVFNTSEDIFSIQISSQSGFNALNEVYAGVDYGGREGTYITDQHFARYEDGDDRVNEFVDDGDLLTAKFNNLYGNVVLIRLSEIYLIRAEARIRRTTRNLAGAAADINVVRNRAKLANTTAVTAAQLLTVVKHERRIELAFEGFRLNDLKRYKETISAIDGSGDTVDIPWDSPKFIFPIPKREIDANGNLVQNEGYF